MIKTTARLCALFSCLALLTSCNAPAPTSGPSSADAVTRIRASGEIKCGYLLYTPYMRRDPVTKQLSGIFYDLMEQVGRNAHLKIVWSEEVGYENIFPALDAKRFDVFCGGLWPNSTRALAATFTKPAFYSTITAWGRPDESGVKSLDQITSGKLRIAVIDGAMEDLISRADFPQNPRVSIPELSAFTLNFENIISRKADVTFAEPSTVDAYLEKRPGALVPIAQGAPLRTFGNALVVRQGDERTRDFLDSAIDEVVQSGQMDRILAKYELTKGSLKRVATPYDVSP